MITSRKVSVGDRLTARSVVASTLLGTVPPRLPAQVLVRAGELFGIADGTTRVALSRMVAAGELTVERGRYHLAGRLVERQDRQRASRAATTIPWDGTWELSVVRAETRTAADRSALRDAAARLRLAERREGVWLRPRNLDPERTPDARVVVAAQCDAFVATPDGLDPGELWPLDAWAAEATALRARLEATVGDLESGVTDALAPGFVLSASVLRHFQHDPLLPPDLLPQGWPGDGLRRDYDRYDTAYRALLATWLTGPAFSTQ